MKGMKGKFMKKLKAANKPIAYLNPDRILQVTAFDNFNFKSNFVDKFQFKSYTTNSKLEKNEQEIQEDKENVFPSVSEDCWMEIEEECEYKRPDMDSRLLFDPKLLAAFRRAVSEHITACAAAAKAEAEAEAADGKIQKSSFFQPEEQPDPLSEPDNETDALIEFDEKCPPAGADSVIFYTTTLRGIRKTFEDCQSIRFLLESFGVVYYERDVSIHSEYREELWRVMGERVLPPRVFIRGRYIGGADKVLTLHEQGKLRALFRDIPINFRDAPCNVCCGLRFMLCYNCNGSRKLFQYDDQEGSDGGVWTKCLHCNENGLVVCPLC